MKSKKKYYAYVWTDGIDVHTMKQTTGADLNNLCQLITGLEHLKLMLIDEYKDSSYSKLKIEK